MALFSNKNTVKIPMTTRKFYADHEITGVKKQLANIKSKYGKFINASAKASNIPDWLIESFIVIESAGIENAENGGTYGLGQLLPAGIQDVIILENNDKKINAAERSALKKYLGTRADTILKYKLPGSALQITKADLLKPEFNITCMAIYLSRLIDECTQNGKVRYDLLPSGYNIGYFGFRKNKDVLLLKNTNQLIDSSNVVTGNYIKKLVGTNGAIEINLKS